MDSYPSNQEPDSRTLLYHQLELRGKMENTDAYSVVCAKSIGCLKITEKDKIRVIVFAVTYQSCAQGMGQAVQSIKEAK